MNRSESARRSNTVGKGGQNRIHDVELREFVNALRGFLRLQPLYGQERERYSGPTIYSSRQGGYSAL